MTTAGSQGGFLLSVSTSDCLMRCDATLAGVVVAEGDLEEQRPEQEAPDDDLHDAALDDGHVAHRQHCLPLQDQLHAAEAPVGAAIATRGKDTH